MTVMKLHANIWVVLMYKLSHGLYRPKVDILQLYCIRCVSPVTERITDYSYRNRKQFCCAFLV